MALYLSGRLRDFHPVVREALALVAVIESLGLVHGRGVDVVPVYQLMHASDVRNALVPDGAAPDVRAIYMCVRAERAMLFPVNPDTREEDEVRLEDEISWRAPVGAITYSPVEWADRWQVAKRAWDAATADERWEIIGPSRARSVKVGLAGALEKRGLPVRAA
jgi:hypothetical protein